MNFINESYFMIKFTASKNEYITVTAYNLSGHEKEWLLVYLTDFVSFYFLDVVDWGAVSQTERLSGESGPGQ